MDRTEFLKVMRESLERKIPQAEIEDNLKYYWEYFEQSGCSDEEVCEELGDPRLIAKSVINAYLASKGSAADQYTQEARREYSQMHGGSSFRGHGQMHGGSSFQEYDQMSGDSRSQENGHTGSAGGFLHQIILVLMIAAVFVLLVFLLRLALVILLPVLLLVLLWKLIRRDG